MDNKKELNMTEEAMLTFDPIVLVLDVVKRWLIVVLAAVMVGVGTYVLADWTYDPVYKTTTTFVVTTRGSSTTVYSNLTSTSNIANLFSELMNSSLMRKTIAQEMGVDSFDGEVSTAVIPNTNLLTVTVSAGNPRTAFLVAQTIIDHHESLTYQVVDGIVLEVLQSPSVPMSPSNYANASGKMKKMMVLAALAAAVLLAVRSFIRDAVRSSKEARKKLDCDYLGDIPHENKYKTFSSYFSRRKTSILITNPVTSFRFIENIRKLRRRVEQHMGKSKVLMVTSLLENEGKSTVAVNLALSMAQKRKRVLLIDCDLRKPACHAVLDQKNFAAGIKELLMGEATPDEAVITYKQTNMDMLLARKGERNIGDLITSRQMQSVLEWARENFDFIVLDLPPMSVASDAEGMTALADACLMVVRQNAAVAPALNKAISSLESHRAKLLGCVLNNVYETQLSSGHGYGYGYGYGGYSKYGHYGHYGHYGNYNKRGSKGPKE